MHTLLQEHEKFFLEIQASVRLSLEKDFENQYVNSRFYARDALPVWMSLGKHGLLVTRLK